MSRKVRRRAGYEGVAVAVPITVPYQRYATQGAHWFVGRALAELVAASGVAKQDIDGLIVSSFSLSPDTAVGVTQHLGMAPRWLDHVPMGGASAVVALRRAARAVQAGDADIVACIGADTNHVDSFRQSIQRGGDAPRRSLRGCGAERRVERHARADRVRDFRRDDLPFGCG